ncbi:MAG: hypothetical protein ACRD4F_16430, partial [Candidatus Angelobacter sp.]
FTNRWRQQIRSGIEWLLQARGPQGWGQSLGAPPDADSTSWAIRALRLHGCEVPGPALKFIRSCQRPNGGFSPYPETSSSDSLYRLSAPDTTVAALRALEVQDPAAEEFLASRLQELPGSWCRLASRLHFWAEILELESSKGSWPLFSRVSQLTAICAKESAFEQAFLLRCLLRLRMQRAWTVAVALRKMQTADGSWPGSAALGASMPGVMVRQQSQTLINDDKRILTTAAAVAALRIGESQPGLYFGSDIPRPRRFCNKSGGEV